MNIVRNVLKNELNIRTEKDFPIKGIEFIDITPLILDKNVLQEIIELFVNEIKEKNIDYIVAPEARGFLLGSAVANQLNIGFIPVRKKGKLPYKTISTTYSLEYGTATIEMHIDAVNKKDNVLIVDDLLATGGTAYAAVELIKKLNANVAACAFVIELTFLNGKDKLKDIPYSSIVQY